MSEGVSSEEGEFSLLISQALEVHAVTVASSAQSTPADVVSALLTIVSGFLRQEDGDVEFGSLTLRVSTEAVPDFTCLMPCESCECYNPRPSREGASDGPRMLLLAFRSADAETPLTEEIRQKLARLSYSESRTKLCEPVGKHPAESRTESNNTRSYIIS